MYSRSIIVDAPTPKRGLIHSDGCRLIDRIRKKRRSGEVTHYKYHEYPRYQFVNTSTGMVDTLLRALDPRNIEWKLHVGEREPVHNAYIVSISRSSAVARMDAFVGPEF
ncbi:hypothetical protein [Nocardiopsis salina]|uniref:hypothetical protein n=1 Tax=Nocardiopsis salina TaxID=245836 RepID=UPI0012688A07|nr:hypothetical protein [Nocardiopsis salina]